MTCQRVWENAEEGRGLHPKPTGGQQSSPPTLQPMHLAYIQARASFGDALGSVSWLPVTLFCVFSSRSTTTRSPLALGQALYEMFPDLQLREVCEALVQDMGLEKVSGSQVHRAVTNVLELTLKRKTEVVCSVCSWCCCCLLRRFVLFGWLSFAAAGVSQALLPSLPGEGQVHRGEHVHIRHLRKVSEGNEGASQYRFRR